jgi:hypothetical protein
VINRKQKQFVINVVIKAMMIPNSCVTLPSTPSRVALVAFRKCPHKKYWVHNPKLEWISYDCPWAQCGNICKHQVKVLHLLHPKLAKGTIACYCGVLKRIVEGSFENLFSPTHEGCSLNDI